jgi:DNA-binding transcriptional LysR family regulator
VPTSLRPSGWVGVELRHFLALEAVATEASFHRAAERLGYTQSAISQQIATLERVIGQRLIERPGGSQPVRLTRAGEIVMEHAHAIGARLATAQADLKALDSGGLDPLRIGFFGHGLGALIPGICRQLEQTRPDVDLRIVESRDGEELAGMLRRGEADVAFVYLPLAGEDCEHVVLLEDDYVLVVRPDSPLAKRTVPPTAEEIASLQLIGLKPVAPCQLDAFFHSHNLEPTWIVGSHDIETIYAFVAAGTGAALLPRLATLSFGPEASIVELGAGIPSRRIGLAWSAARQPSEAVEAFVRAARGEAARLTRSPRLSVAL